MLRNHHGNCRVSGAAVLMVLVFIGASGLLAMGQTSVTTYHYDTYRTGWNQNESVLTPANVGTTAFGLLQNVKLDDQVDAQPLVMPGVLITAGSYQGTHDVVYVATENNTVYAIDVHSGTILLSPNFGTPVSSPLGCNNNGPNVGINSTPVIDPSSNTLYVMVYTQGASGPTYTLHALNPGSLTDKVTPQVVSASHTLTNGTTFNFNATYQRQRPALLLANGSIYAGFGSFCDYSANLSRGWLLGWTAGTLAPFPSNRLNDQQPTAPNSFFLSSVWMSGYGPAADDTGNVLFVTGNSDPSGTTYDGVTNIQESVVKVSSTLTSVEGLFTPDDESTLDQEDEDFGSGGVLVLPDQPGALPHLAVAAGKDGNMYFMNEDSLGGYSSTANNVLGTYQVGGCWCGQSYYVDPTDGLGRVVSSGGNTVEVWKVQTSPTAALTNVTNASVSSSSVQDPGFFTSISSNGTANPIIWALSRPASNSNGSPISLYAFNPDSGGSTMTQLFQATAGAWPNTTGNANLVPVVANGLVFVASHQQLQIFGLTGTPATPPTFSPAPGNYTSAQSVTLSDITPSAIIYYTTNGTAPTTSSTPYTAGKPIHVSATTTIEAIAAASGYGNSAVTTGIYTIATASPITPYIQVNSGSWQQVASVTVSQGAVVNLGPQPLTGGSWSWTGPNKYTSTSRQINSIPLGTGTNTYVATYTNTSGATSTQTFTITVTGASTPIVPYIQVNSGNWQQIASATVSQGAVVNLGPQPLTGGSWSWTGPNKYTSTSRQINSIPLSTGINTYVATYTNTSGATSTQTFTITVTGASTPIVPYIQVNNGRWQQISSETVSPGAVVNLGPQPLTGGSWSWTGPHGYTSTSRQINSIPLSTGTNTYVATYTNASGATSTETFTITVN